MELLCGIGPVEHARWRVIATEHHGSLLDASPLLRSGLGATKVPSATILDRAFLAHLSTEN